MRSRSAGQLRLSLVTWLAWFDGEERVMLVTLLVGKENFELEESHSPELKV